jgi:CheY-like chemotaxis protein
MDMETRQRCLEPFFTTKGERGTGLGLAMVFGMAQRHSATIEIDSVPGTGTTVRLAFMQPSSPMFTAGVDGASTEALPPLNLLLIEDDPVLLKSLRDILEDDGHRIITAPSGAEGLMQFRKASTQGVPFAAVITDLGMPHIDGRRVAVAIKEISPSTPVVLLTGWGQRIVADGEIPPCVDRVLAKPAKLRDLRRALFELCPRGD